jgi:hypothetical protein
MDILKGLAERRQHAMMLMRPPIVSDGGMRLEKPKSKAIKGGKKTKAQRAEEHEPGTKDMRRFIVEEKPSAKIVREHLNAKIAMETASSDEDEA